MQRPDSLVFIEFIRIASASLLAASLVGAAGCVAGPVDAAALERPPAPGDIEVVTPLVLAERARVPEKEPGFLGAELSGSELRVDHDGRLRAFSPGDVLGGTAGGGHLVRVTRVRSEARGHVVLETEPAALTELIREGHFRVHYDALEYERRIVEALRADVDADPAEEVGASADALTLAGKTRIRLLEVSGADLPASCGVDLAGDATLDVTAELIPVIDFELHIGPKGGLNPKPELEELSLLVSGTLKIDAALHGTGEVVGSCEVDLLELAGGAPKLPLPTLTFWVGPVPVVITSEVVPTAKAELELSWRAAELTAEAHAEVGILTGVEYEQKTWHTVWEPWAEASGGADIDSPGDITAAAKVSAGAELRSRLYGILGPTVGVDAYARAVALTAPPYCTAEGRVDGGVSAHAEAEAGVSLGPLDLTLVSLPLVEHELFHFDGPDFEVPLRDAPECSAE